MSYWKVIKILFMNAPYVAAAVTYLTFVRPAPLSRRAKALWAAALAVCSAETLVAYFLYGNVFQPKFPELVGWIWNWALFGALFLCLLSLATVRLKGRWKLWLLPAVAWATSAVGVVNAVVPPEVKTVELAFADLPAELDGYRLVQVSDVHVSPTLRRWRSERIVATVNALGADLVCMTGDYVDGTVADRLDDFRPLAGLKAKDGVYWTTGNHEYYFAWGEWAEAYESLGLRFLANECVFPRKSLALAGVNDNAVEAQRGGRSRPGPIPDVRQAFAAATNGEFRVLLKHKPKDARRHVGDCGVRLQLSGHTHGGIMPGLDLFIKYTNDRFTKGLYELGDGFLYVNSGAGQSGALPLRFLAPSEITLFVLKRNLL